MNQILITKKLYVTPELKRKKKMYKFDFFISVFLVCVLFSYYIYAEYDRSKHEKVSHDILATVNFDMLAEVEEENTNIRVEDGVLVVKLNEQVENKIKLSELLGETENGELKPIVHTTETGKQYSTVSVLNIPKLGINYPVLSESTDELLKISGLSHGTDVWAGNAKDFMLGIKKGFPKIPFPELIGCRDDIMVYLMSKNLPPREAFNIMEKVRKVKGVSKEHGRK